MTRIKTQDIKLSVSETDSEEWWPLSPNVITRSSINSSFVNKNRVVRRRLDNNKSVFTNLTSGIAFEHDLTYDLANNLKQGLTGHIVRNAELINIPCHIQFISNGNIIIQIQGERDYLERLQVVFNTPDVYNIQISTILWLHGFGVVTDRRAVIHTSLITDGVNTSIIYIDVKNSIEEDGTFDIVGNTGYITVVGFRLEPRNTVSANWNSTTEEFIINITNDVNKLRVYNMIEKQYVHIGSITHPSYELENFFSVTGAGFARIKNTDISNNRLIFDNVDSTLQADFTPNTAIDVLTTDYSELPKFDSVNYEPKTYDLELDYGNIYRYIDNNVLTSFILRLVTEGKAVCTLSFDGLSTETTTQRVNTRIDTDKHDDYTTSLEVARLKIYDVDVEYRDLTITFTTPISQKRMLGNTGLSKILALGTSISISGTLVIADFTIAEKLQNSRLLSLDLILSNHKDGVIVFDFPTLQLTNATYTYNRDQSITANIQAEAKALDDILYLSYIGAPVIHGRNESNKDNIFPQIFTGDIVGNTGDVDDYYFTLTEERYIDAIILETDPDISARLIDISIRRENGRTISRATSRSFGAGAASANLVPGRYFVRVRGLNELTNTTYLAFINNSSIYPLTEEFPKYTETSHLTYGRLYLTRFSIPAQYYILVSTSNFSTRTEEEMTINRTNLVLFDFNENVLLSFENSSRYDNIHYTTQLDQGIYFTEVQPRSTDTDTDYTINIELILPSDIQTLPITSTGNITFKTVNYIYFSIASDITLLTEIRDISNPLDDTDVRVRVRTLGTTTNEVNIIARYGRVIQNATELSAGTYYAYVAGEGIDTNSEYTLTLQEGRLPERANPPVLQSRTNFTLAYTTDSVELATSYIWRLSTDSIFDSENTTTIETNTPNIEFTGLIRGTQYWVDVVAKNIVGEGPRSDSVTNTTILNPVTYPLSENRWFSGGAPGGGWSRLSNTLGVGTQIEDIWDSDIGYIEQIELISGDHSRSVFTYLAGDFLIRASEDLAHNWLTDIVTVRIIVGDTTLDITGGATFRATDTEGSEIFTLTDTDEEAALIALGATMDTNDVAVAGTVIFTVRDEPITPQ